MVGYNVEALHHEELIEVRIPSERTGQWAYWPVNFTEKGQVLLDAARNEIVWKEALEQIEATGVNLTLNEMKKMLEEI